MQQASARELLPYLASEPGTRPSFLSSECAPLELHVAWATRSVCVIRGQKAVTVTVTVSW